MIGEIYNLGYLHYYYHIIGSNYWSKKDKMTYYYCTE